MYGKLTKPRCRHLVRFVGYLQLNLHFCRLSADRSIMGAMRKKWYFSKEWEFPSGGTPTAILTLGLLYADAAGRYRFVSPHTGQGTARIATRGLIAACPKHVHGIKSGCVLSRP
jgi:hypothetical protein